MFDGSAGNDASSLNSLGQHIMQSFELSKTATASARDAFVVALTSATDQAIVAIERAGKATDGVATLAARIVTRTPALKGMDGRFYDAELSGAVRQQVERLPLASSAHGKYCSAVKAFALAAAHGIKIPTEGKQSEIVTALNGLLRKAGVIEGNKGQAGAKRQPAMAGTKAKGKAADAKAASAAKEASKGQPVKRVTFDAMREAAFIVALEDENRAMTLAWVALHKVKALDAFLAPFVKEAMI